MGRRKSCCVPAVLRTTTTTHPCARNKFFKHIHNFLWALPSWKSLAPVHKMIGKITRKNIINICSSYRPCPVRRNIEKSTSGKVYKPIGDRLAHPRYFPAVPLGFRQAFLPRFWPDPVSNSFFAPTGCSKRRGYPLSHGCLTRNPRTFRRGRWDSATASGRPRESGIHVESTTSLLVFFLCGLVCTSGLLLTGHHGTSGQG